MIISNPNPENIFAIIAEFNPLHYGHEFLLQNLRANHSVIVILSSNFVQRGEPAIVDKFYRAEMAIKAGADLVIELPFIYACAAAQDFAFGAVEILRKTNLAGKIAFGMEDPDYDFAPIVETLLHEPEAYREFLREKLREGFSFPKANSLALENLFDGAGEFIAKPNNLLAVSYVMNLRKCNCNLEIVPFKRVQNLKSSEIRENLGANFRNLPNYSREIITRASVNHRLCENYQASIWNMLRNIFLRSSPEDLRKIYAIDEGIENLFLKHWKSSRNLREFVSSCVSSRYTKAHVNRRLIYIMLNLEREIAESVKISGINYARILAFNHNGRLLLKNFAKNSQIPIITTPSKLRNNSQAAILERKVSELYELLLPEQDFRRENLSVLKF